jgi:HK97 family phage major capsid protein
MDEETKKLLEAANKNLTDLQGELQKVSSDKKTYEDKINSLSAENKAKVEKIEAEMKMKDGELLKFQQERDAHATKIRNLEATLEELKKNNTPETLQRVKDLELQIAHMDNTSGDKKKNLMDDLEYQAIQDYAMKGELPEKIHRSDSKEPLPSGVKYLRTDVGADGGYLVPEVLYSQIMEEVEEIDPIRSLARVFSAKVKSLSVAIRSDLPTAEYEGEAESDEEDNSKYRDETLTAYRLGLTTKVTWDSINFSAFDIIAQLSRDAAMGFAIKEGNKFLLGTGQKQPEGILINSDVVANTVDSAASGVVSLIDVIKLAGYLKAGYLPNARYFMNQKTLYNLRTEKDDAGNFLWRIGGENMPSNIAGIPFIILPSMANVAGSSLSVGLGDFFYGYYILDAVGISLIRDDVTSKRTGKVEFTWKMYNTGQVAISEAFKVLKTKA